MLQEEWLSSQIPGIPSVNIGTKDPVQAALLAVSGAASPRIEPLTKFLALSAWRQIALNAVA